MFMRAPIIIIILGGSAGCIPFREQHKDVSVWLVALHIKYQVSLPPSSAHKKKDIILLLWSSFLEFPPPAAANLYLSP